MSKNLLSRHIFSAIIFLLLLASFSGCNNMTSDNTKPSDDGKAYLSINVVSASRTALPQFTVPSISDFQFTIEGKGPGESAFAPITTESNTNGIYSSLSALTSAVFPIETGAWTFKLTASKDGTVLSDEVSPTIITGSNSISFNLVWDDTSFSGTGDLSFTFDFSGASNASDVAYATTELLAYNSSNGEYETSVDETSIGFDNSKVIYSPSNLNAGNYKIIIRLYGDIEKKNLMFTWPELAIITGGQTSTGSRTITSLNELYDINWHNLELDGVTAPTTLPLKYTRLSDVYNLPAQSEVSRTGYIFEGWYSDENYETPITKIPANSTGTIDIYARFIDKIYITDGGDAYTDGVDGTRESTALDSIDSAISKIIEYAEPSVNWKIVVVGEVKGQQTIPDTFTTAYAAGLTIIGKTGNTTDILNANLSSATDDGTTLIVNSAVPLAIQSIKITGGNNSKSMGPGALYVSAEGASVNLIDILISNNKKSDCSVKVAENASLTLSSGDIIGSVGISGNNSGTGLLCSGTFTMLGGTIRNNSSSIGGGVRICGGTFRMGGGAIYNNNASTSSYGGGVRICGGDMFMYGDAVIGDDSKSTFATSTSLCSNYAQLGGGLYLEGNVGYGDANCYIGYYDADTPRECTGGIYYNYSTEMNGGGVSVNHGKLVINTGNIKYNGSDRSIGGISFSSTTDASVEITGGEIRGNKGIALWGNNISMQGNLYFPVDDGGNNTISGNITVTGALTPPAECTDGIVAKFSFGDSDVGTQAVSVKTGSGLDLATVCQQFASDNSIYYITDDGIVHGIPVIASVAGTPYYTQTSAYNAIKDATGSDVAVVLGAGCTQTILGKADTADTLANAIKSTSATSIALSVASGVTITLPADCSNMFKECSKLASFSFNGFNTSSVTSMDSMFRDCSKLSSIDFQGINTSSVEDMDYMFCYCSLLGSLDLTSFDTSNVKTMWSMFFGCESLTALNVSSFDTSKVEVMVGLFANCSSLQTLDITNFNTSKCTQMHQMFYGCEKLTAIDLTNFDTSKADGFTNMFSNCKALTVLDLSSFDTSSATSASQVFSDCRNLITIIVTDKFDLSGATVYDGIFTGCTSLVGGKNTTWDESNPTDKTYAKIDGGTSDPGYFTQVYAKVGKTTCMSKTETKTAIAALDATTTPEVTIVLYNGVTASDLGMSQSGSGILASMNSNSEVNMHLIVDQNANIVIQNGAGEAMFLGLDNLLSADLRGFNTSAATRMGTMFSECYNLIELNLSSFDTSLVEDMEGMFSYCYALPQLDLSSFDTSNVTDCMNYMFQDCRNLETIYVTTAFVTTNASEVSDMFDGCSSKLTGGSGTTWSASNPKDNTYARIDDPSNGHPGYFTQVKLGSKDSPTAVGDIVFSDGTATPYTTETVLTSLQKAKAVAVIFYVGTSSSDILGEKTLGIGVQNGSASVFLGPSRAWAIDGTDGLDCITDIICTPERTGTNGAVNSTYFEGDKDGSDNWQAICDFVSDEETAGNYPVWEWVNDYANKQGSHVKNTAYESGWYMPTVAELSMVYRVMDSIQNALTEVGTPLNTYYYWTSSQIGDTGYEGKVYNIHLNTGLIYKEQVKTNGSAPYACVIRQFN